MTDNPILFIERRRLQYILTAIVVGLVATAVYMGVAPTSAKALIENNQGMPPSVLSNFFSNPGCWNPAGNRNERHGQFIWLSPAGDSTTESITLAPGQTSVDLWLNAATVQCNSNVDGAGRLIDRSLERTRATTVSSSTTAGNLSFVTQTATLNMDCSNWWDLRWVTICGQGPLDVYPTHQDLRLSNLGSLGPGTHNVTITAQQRLIHQYAGGIFRCVAQVNGNIVPASSLSDPNCGTTPIVRTITIVIPPPANPVYNLTPTVSCNIQAGVVSYAISKTGAGAANNISVQLYYTLSGSAEQSVAQGNLNNSDFSWTRSFTVPTPAVGQTLSARMVVNPGSSTLSGPGAAASGSCPVTGPRTARPYFRVYGGDVIAGRGIDNAGDSSCNPKDNNPLNAADIRAFSAQGSNGAWVGAGGQFAVSASGYIQGFTSSSMRNRLSPSVAPRPSTGLVFSNFDTISGNPLETTVPNSAGGDIAGYSGCTSDIWGIIRSATGLLTGGFGMPGGSGPDVVLNDDLSQGNMIYWGAPTESVTISRNIVHRESSSNPNPVWNSIDEVRVPIVAVEGDINISPEVTRLDGLYFAKGTINTCYTSNVSLCNRKLTINGALIANRVNFGRTIGDIGSIDASAGDANQTPSSGGIAEVIDFTPNIYLVLSRISRTTDLRSNNSYDSIVGLPPIL